MASTGTVYVSDTQLTRRGQVQSWGRIKVGHQATLEARDFFMKSLFSVVLTPIGLQGGATGPNIDMVPGSIGSTATRHYRRSWVNMVGSIGSVGALNNNFRVRTYYMRTFGSFTMPTAAPQGTKGLYIGTAPGSFAGNYFAIGR